MTFLPETPGGDPHVQIKMTTSIQGVGVPKAMSAIPDYQGPPGWELVASTSLHKANGRINKGWGSGSQGVSISEAMVCILGGGICISGGLRLRESASQGVRILGGPHLGSWGVLILGSASRGVRISGGPHLEGRYRASGTPPLNIASSIFCPLHL